MPYDSNGNASVTRNPAVTGQTVLAEQVNVPLADIQAMLGQVVLKSGVAPMTGPLNSNGFRQLNVGDPTTDSDGANKNYVDDQITSALNTTNSNARKIEIVNANRLALLADKATSFRVTGARTITLTAAATLLANWWCEVWAVDSQVIIDPDASETINGNSTLVLSAGQKAIVFGTGTAFFAFVTSDAQSGVQLQGYSFGLALSNNAVDAANYVDITSGKAASDASPFNLMVLGSALTKRIDAAWSVGSGNGGLDTGGVLAAGTYYVWIIQRSDTLVVDALFSLSGTAPTMPLGYNRKRLIGSFQRNGGVNSQPVSALVFSSEVKVWANINGISGASIRASKGVSSASRVGVGSYVLNFLAPLEDTNYSVVATGYQSSSGIARIVSSSVRTTTSCNLLAFNSSSGAAVDLDYLDVIILR